MSETFTVTYKPKNRKWTMRPLPKSLFIMFGQIPGELTEIAAEALKRGDESAFEAEITKTLSREEMIQQAIFAREAVKYALISPKISLTPRAGEISAFDVSDDEFKFLFRSAAKGGQAEGLESFRGEPDKTAGNSTNGAKKRKKRK